MLGSVLTNVLRILSETGLKIDVIYASDYVDEINYLPAIYDSFVMAPFAVDELLNPKKWRKEIAFSLIDEVGFSGKFLSGGNGLLTWNGIKKPWWHAYMLLAKLRGNVVDQGEDYMGISTREDFVSKLNILLDGGLIFPTMSDKKSWKYLRGI